MTESDNALMLRVAREEIKRQAAEIEYLKARLEVSAYHPYDGIVSRDATIKLQDEHIAKLQAENASIRELLSKKVVDSTMLTDLGIRGGGINATFEGGAAGLIATTFAEQFREAGATNYLELTFEDKELGEFVVTMQRKDGETPGYQKAKAEARAAELEQDAARYHYIRTHRIGVKWCELYAGGPLLDGVIDSFISAANPKPIKHAALRAAAQKE